MQDNQCSVVIPPSAPVGGAANGGRRRKKREGQTKDSMVASLEGMVPPRRFGCPPACLSWRWALVGLAGLLFLLANLVNVGVGPAAVRWNSIAELSPIAARRQSEGLAPEPAAGALAWRGGGVLGASAVDVRAALDRAFITGFEQWRSGLNSSAPMHEAIRRVREADHPALAEVYTAMRAAVAVTRFGSQDCMLAATPVYVAQCLTSAVAVMSLEEAETFAAVAKGAATALPSVFRNVAAFRSTVCAQLCPCMVWASGRVPTLQVMRTAARPAAVIAKAAEPFLKHFGAHLGNPASNAVPSEIDALQHRMMSFFGGQNHSATPLIPAQPVADPAEPSDKNNNSTGLSDRTMHYDAGAETLVIRGPNGRNEQALALPSAADLVTVLTAASHVRGRDPVRHGVRMPGLVAFSGDSMVRGLFGEVVGLLRRGPLYYDSVTGTTVDADPTGLPIIHSRSLYVRFSDVDVYISNMLGFFETSPETSHPDVRRAYWAEAEAMLGEMLAGNATATTTDMVRFLVEVARPLAREHGSQPEGTLRFVARALRALCDAKEVLCPVLVLTYEFDQMAERPLTSHMPAEAAEAFLALRSQHRLGHERLGALPEHAPVEDLMPISVHLYSHGMQATGDSAVAARQLTRFLLPARGLSPATAPIFVQRLASGYVNRNHAVPVGLDFIRAERAGRRAESAANRILSQAVPPPLSSPHWSSRRRVLAVGSKSVESAHLSGVGVVPATHAILRSTQMAKTPAYMGPPPPLSPTTPGPPPPVAPGAQQATSVSVSDVNKLLSLHLPPPPSALEPLRLVPVTTATCDVVASLLASVRSRGISHFGDANNPDGHAAALQRGTSLLTLMRQLHAFAADLLFPPTSAISPTTAPPATTAQAESGLPPAIPAHRSPGAPPLPPLAPSAFATDLAGVVVGGHARLREQPALTAAVIASAYVYDAMLLQTIFPFSGADHIHVNTMLFFQRDASLDVVNANRLGCAVGDCARRDLGALSEVQSTNATTTRPNPTTPLLVGSPSAPPASPQPSTMYALTGRWSSLVMGHLHSAFLQTTAPRPGVVEEDSEENAAAEARVLAVALQGNIVPSTFSIGVPSASTTNIMPQTVPPPAAPIVLAAFFNEHFPVDMLVGSGCDHVMLGRARMLPFSLSSSQDQQEGGDLTTTMAARINARLDRDGPSAAPRLLEQTPGCAHTYYFSHSIGGRNPMQRLELALLLAHVAAAQTP